MATPIPENHARFTMRELAAATGGRLTRVPDEQAHVRGVVTDSRAARAGNVFIALRGDVFDGHDFLGRAVERRALALIVEPGAAVPPGPVAVLEVMDSRVAFGLLARAHLRRWRARHPGRARVAAITGSSGKTTTKELTAAILGRVAPCHSTTGNLNNLVGVPSVALAIEEQTYAVFELGMSVPGEIAALSGIVEADVAALLNVGVAHAGSFGGSRAEVGREKGAIFEALGPGGVAVVNLDDPAAEAQLLRCPLATHVRFGTSPGADVRLLEREPVGTFGSRVTLGRRGESFQVHLAGASATTALNLAAAVAVADATVGQRVPGAVVADAIEQWRPSAGRAVLLELTGDILVLDDSYNANPASMCAALATLTELRRARGGRAIAVLGEMRELGEIAEVEHDRVGRELARLGVDVLVGCGGLIDVALRGAESHGVSVRRAGGAEDAGAMLVEEARPGDVVLFKGSRGAAVEKALAVFLTRWPALPRGGEAR